MGELVDHANAELSKVYAEQEQRLGATNAPRCSCCGAVRAVYGRKHEPKLCRPCTYLTAAERTDRACRWLLKCYDYLLDIMIAKQEVARAKKLERILEELLKREIDASRPPIQPTGLQVVAGLDLVASRFNRYLRKGEP